MTIRQESISNRDYSAQVTSEANDLGVGVAIVPAAITGLSPLLLWYSNPLANYFKRFPEGARVLAQDTGRIWNVGVDDTGAKAIYLVTTGSGSSSGMRGFVYVDASAAAGGDGSPGRPYNKLQLALNAVLANTAILMAAGTYVEDVVMPNVEGIAIHGAGRGITILQNLTNTHTFAWIRAGAVPVVARFLMSDLTIRCNAATATNCGVMIDANAETPVAAPAVNAFGMDGLFFASVDIIRSGIAAGRSAFLRRITNVEWRDCVWRGDVSIAGTIVTENLGRGTAYASVLSNLDTQWLRSSPVPSGGRNALSLLAGTAVAPTDNGTPALQGGVILRGHPILVADVTTLLSGSTGVPAIQGVGLTTTSSAGGLGPSSAPVIQVSGTIGQSSTVAGSGAVTLPLPAFAAGFGVPVADFSQATFLVVPAAAGSFTVTSATPSVASQTVLMNQSRLAFLSAAGAAVANAITVGSATAGINNPVILDARQAFYYAQSVFSIAANSFLDRSVWSLPVASIPVLSTAVAITPAYPQGSTYNAFVESGSLISVGISLKSTTGLTIQGSLLGGASTITLIRT